MPEIELIPLSQADVGQLAGLMHEEEKAWLRELDWDYTPIRRILTSFLQARILPGFLAAVGSGVLGYTYFLISRSKGMIGTVYVHDHGVQQTADLILSRAIDTLKATRPLRRIEAQIIPLGGVDLTPIFARHGFQCYPRQYLELDLHNAALGEPEGSDVLTPWQPEHLSPAAKVAHCSYRKSVDAAICEDYQTEASCGDYLRSLTESPGCGIFLPDCSFTGMDSKGVPCGFVLASRLSSDAAMIPQISILPSHQGRRLGSLLIQQAMRGLRSAGFRYVRLTVSVQNRRAHEWYGRLGFKLRREFGAYVWTDSSPVAAETKRE